MHEKLKTEIRSDYDIAIRKAIVDYILLDPSERQRVRIHRIPKVHRTRTIRGPIVWHETINETKTALQVMLHVTNPMMAALQRLWDETYAEQRLVSFRDLSEAPLPMVPLDFEKFIEQRVEEMRQILISQ